MKNNFKKVLSVVMVLAMLVATMTIVPLTASAASLGESLDNPYLIYDAEDLLNKMGTDDRTARRYYKLMDDIDMTDYDDFYSCKYDGGLYIDGNGKTISNLTIKNSNSGNGIGLIATTKGPVEIFNITFENLTVQPRSAYRFIGGILGYASTGSVDMNNCTITSGTIQCKNTTYSIALGGMIGIATDTACNVTMTNCVNNADVIDTANTSGNTMVGGLMGVFDLKDGSTFTLTNCKNTGTIQAAVATTGYYLGQLYGKFHASANPADLIVTNCVKQGMVKLGETVLEDNTGDVGGDVGGGDDSGNDPVVVPTDFSLRLKLTDAFGVMVIADGVDGFVFTTDASADAASLTKVEGAAYEAGSTKVYAIYSELTAAELNTTIYFAAYVVDNGNTYYSELCEINAYEAATDLQDGIYGNDGTNAGVLITEDTYEMELYVAMCNYCDKFQAYLANKAQAAA